MRCARAFLSFGPFLAALGCDGPVPFALGPGQCFGGAPVDVVAGFTQQPFHQTCPTEAVGLEDEGPFPEQVAAAPEAGLVGVPGRTFQKMGDGGLLP